jgi:hypothetical protein
LSTFGDLSLAGVLFAVESWLMSWGTLYRGSRVRNHQEGNTLVTSIPFLALDRDLPTRTRWRSQSRSLGRGFINFDPVSGFPHGFLGFFRGVELAVAFHLPAQVLRALAPAPTEGSLIDSSSGGRAETGMVGIEMSPSKPAMGEMKLSKACIQTDMKFDSKKAMKYDITGAPYRVPLNPNMVGSHLLVGWPAGSVLEYLS